MSQLWGDVKDSLRLLLRYAFCVALIGFGFFGIYQEKFVTKVTDPHAILVAIGLLLMPFFPREIAGAIKQVGSAIAEAWKARTSA